MESLGLLKTILSKTDIIATGTGEPNLKKIGTICNSFKEDQIKMRLSWTYLIKPN